MEDLLLARRVGAAFHQGQDVHALPQSPRLDPEASRLAARGGVLRRDDAAAERGDDLADDPVDDRRVPFSMVRERSTRQWRFALLRSGRLGVD
jgi:hypothetical protein